MPKFNIKAVSTTCFTLDTETDEDYKEWLENNELDPADATDSDVITDYFSEMFAEGNFEVDEPTITVISAEPAK